MTTFVLATHNAHKVEELRRILGERLGPHQLVGYDGPEPVEDGDDLRRERAHQGAGGRRVHRAARDRRRLRHLGSTRSAARRASTRRATPAPATTATTTACCSTNLRGRRRIARAQFVCAAAFVDGDVRARRAAACGRAGCSRRPSGATASATTRSSSRRGSRCSSAELTADEKNAQSHRARAFGALVARAARALRLTAPSTENGDHSRLAATPGRASAASLPWSHGARSRAAGESHPARDRLRHHDRRCSRSRSSAP